MLFQVTKCFKCLKHFRQQKRQETVKLIHFSPLSVYHLFVLSTLINKKSHTNKLLTKYNTIHISLSFLTHNKKVLLLFLYNHYYKNEKP